MSAVESIPATAHFNITFVIEHTTLEHVDFVVVSGGAGEIHATQFGGEYAPALMREFAKWIITGTSIDDHRTPHFAASNGLWEIKYATMRGIAGFVEYCGSTRPEADIITIGRAIMHHDICKEILAHGNVCAIGYHRCDARDLFGINVRAKKYAEVA